MANIQSIIRNMKHDASNWLEDIENWKLNAEDFSDEMERLVAMIRMDIENFIEDIDKEIIL